MTSETDIAQLHETIKKAIYQMIQLNTHVCLSVCPVRKTLILAQKLTKSGEPPLEFFSGRKMVPYVLRICCTKNKNRIIGSNSNIIREWVWGVKLGNIGTNLMDRFGRERIIWKSKTRELFIDQQIKIDEVIEYIDSQRQVFCGDESARTHRMLMETINRGTLKRSEGVKKRNARNKNLKIGISTPERLSQSQDSTFFNQFYN